jgi:uncharacterized protein YegL
MELNRLKKVTAKKALTRALLFVVDTAGNMKDAVLKTVNSAIGEVISDIRTISAKCDDVKYEIAVLPFFGKDARLEPFPPVDIAGYSWNGLIHSGEYAAKISFALRELNERSFFMNGLAHYLPPAVILIVNSAFEADDNYWKELEKMRDEPQFKTACKAVVFIGENIRGEELLKEMAEFTGNRENIVVVNGFCDNVNHNNLRENIRKMSFDGAFCGLLNKEDIQKLLDEPESTLDNENAGKQ